MKTLTYKVWETDDYREGPRFQWEVVPQIEQAHSEAKEHQEQKEDDSESNSCDDETCESDYSDDEDDDSEEDRTGVEYIDLVVDSGSNRVYHVSFDIGWVSQKFLKEFSRLSDAKLYCKQQYYLHTDHYPFIPNGKMSCSYHPSGNRPAVDVPDEMECHIKDNTIDSSSYLVIVTKGGHLLGFSLGSFSVWYDA